MVNPKDKNGARGIDFPCSVWFSLNFCTMQYTKIGNRLIICPHIHRSNPSSNPFDTMNFTSPPPILSVTIAAVKNGSAENIPSTLCTPKSTSESAAIAMHKLSGIILCLMSTADAVVNKVMYNITIAT